MPEQRRETVQFLPNSPERVTFSYSGGKEYPSQFDERKTVTMYTLDDGRVLWADEVLAAKINFIEPRAGDSLWICKRYSWQRKGKKPHRSVEWEITTDGASAAPLQTQQPATPIRAQDMGIDETDLERDLRASVQMRQRAQTRVQARDNLARVPEWVEEAPHPADAAPAPIRKPAAQEIVASQPAPAARPPQSAPQAMPQTQLEAALQTVMAACKSATAYARQIEYQAPPFTSDDIARMAMTLVIGKEQRR